jgi:maleate cis-trans isomerase
VEQQKPIYRIGSIGPTAGDGTGGPQQQQRERLLPDNIVSVSAGLGIKDYTVEGVEEAMGNWWPCVDKLVAAKADRICQVGMPISAQLKRPRMLKLLEETQEKTGVPADCDFECVVEAMKHLGVSKVAVGSRWADQLNEAVTAYLADAGIEVLSMTTEGQWAAEAFGMSIEQGIVFAFRLGREAMRQAPQAQGLLLPGGTWRALAAIPILEEDLGVPIFSNTANAAAWRLIHEGLAPPVKGWGKLLETP